MVIHMALLLTFLIFALGPGLYGAYRLSRITTPRLPAFDQEDRVLARCGSKDRLTLLVDSG